VTARRAVLVVLDGLGVGPLDDRTGSSPNTLRSVVEEDPDLRLPSLGGLGLADAAGLPGLGRIDPRLGAGWGVARLGYDGADTYLGHRALMGAAAARIRLHMLRDRLEEVTGGLVRGGHRVEIVRRGDSALLVDGVAVVADNIEAAPGLSVNVTASLDEIGFDELLDIGRMVREQVSLARVIVVGGRGYTAADVVAAIRERSPGHAGVDTPGLGVYDANYQVRHLGAGSGDEPSLPDLLVASGRRVVLLGKAADVIECRAAERDTSIPVAAVFDRLAEALTPAFEGLIVANVQETDLAGHEQDARRFGRVLAAVDARLPAVLEALGPDGTLLVSADHGNDPAIGHSQHTRELVPVLAAGVGIPPGPLGERATLSDIGATLAAVLGVGSLAAGASFADLTVPAVA
jgi:phosphopentomutase